MTDVLESIALIVTLLMIVLFIIYYIWIAILVTKNHQNLEVYHTSQGACIKSPLEIETTRYQTMYLHKEYNEEDYDHEDVQEAKYKNLNVIFGLFSGILCGSTLIAFGISVRKTLPLKGVNAIIFVSTLILTIALFTNNFTENKVIKAYIDAYKELKNRLDKYIINTTLASGNKTVNISKLEDLPEEIMTSLVQRYSAYNEVTNYFKIPVYSEYEMYQKVKGKLEKPVSGEETVLRLDELMRFLKFNYDNDRVNLKTDMDILVNDESEAEKYKTLSGNKFDPYESLKKQYMNIITALIFVTILIIYYVFHSIYTKTDQVGLLVTVISLLVLVMVLILMVYRFTL